MYLPISKAGYKTNHVYEIVALADHLTTLGIPVLAAMIAGMWSIQQCLEL